MNNLKDKRFLGVIVTFVFSIFSLYIVSLLLNQVFILSIFAIILLIRVIASFVLFDDYKLSWSKASTKTGLMKILLSIISFAVYCPILYLAFDIPFNLLFIDLVFYTFILI